MDTINYNLMDSTFNFVCTKRMQPVNVVKSKSRERELVVTRQIYCYLIRKYFNSTISLAVAGSYINRDHTTVLHAIRCIETLIETDKAFKREMDDIESEYVISTVEAMKRKTKYSLTNREYDKLKMQVYFQTEKVNAMYYEAVKLMSLVNNTLIKDNVIEGFRKSEIESKLNECKKKVSKIKMETLV